MEISCERKKHDRLIRYSITGKAAHGRLRPLLPSNWVDCSPYACALKNDHCTTTTTTTTTTIYDNNGQQDHQELQFIWENAPRNETKPFRDGARCYSHLPNGIEILDDKWVLGRLLSGNNGSAGNDNVQHESSIDGNAYFASLETHCFRGRLGLRNFSKRMQRNNKTSKPATILQLMDLDPAFNTPSKQRFAPKPENLWVIKDAKSNGYGGIWIMNVDDAFVEDSESESASLLDEKASPLQDDHRYVAQRYTWPPVLYQGKKCHIRVYAIVTNGKAFIHKRCFLHVANEEFVCGNASQVHDHDQGSCGKGQEFDPAVHITNCCANSHDKNKFAGEILADFEKEQSGANVSSSPNTVGLKQFFPSVAASVKVLAQKAMPFLQGGEKNSGFEYLGLDFILSHREDEDGQRLPVAFLLEVNCPPSQDTATGLDYAENLHDEVLRDLINMWVVPNVLRVYQEKAQLPKDMFGWKCVYEEHKDKGVAVSDDDLMIPSKAGILNKIRWGMFERRIQKEEKQRESLESIENGLRRDCSGPCALEPLDIANFARTQFPFFSNDKHASSDTHDGYGQRKSHHVFLENAGGSQVPLQVINCMVESLSHRNRSIIGQKSKNDARKVSIDLLGGSHDRHKVFFGANASSLFDRLACLIVRSGFLSKGDEIILASENHTANVIPWVKAAESTGAHILWWTRRAISEVDRRDACIEDNCLVSSNLGELLSEKTRIVSLSHSSNILGSVRDVRSLCLQVRKMPQKIQIIVDGVAAAPHMYAAVDNLGVDWYCISCHKLFGPHIGILVGKNEAVNKIVLDSSSEKRMTPHKVFETGTLNYEGCSGIIGLGHYFSTLASFECRTVAAKFIDRSSQPGQDPVQKPKVSAAGVELSSDVVIEAYRRFSVVEQECVGYVLKILRSVTFVRLIEDHERIRLPIVTFVHEALTSSDIVEYCSQRQISVRCGSFLTTDIIQTEFDINGHCKEGGSGVVRISFSHYNTLEDARRLIAVLQSIDGWDNKRS